MMGPGEGAVDDARVAADAVDPVDGEVPRLELLRDGVRPSPREARGGAGVTARPEQV